MILAAYREWGTACVERLDGMFALALWDGPRRRLFIARDRLGKKPLHYRIDRDGLAFASEPKAFLAEPGFSARGRSAGGLALPEPAVRAGAAVGVQGRDQAAAGAHARRRGRRGCRCSATGGCPTRRRSTCRTTRPKPSLTARLRTAVRQRLISDVPLGAFLSGGIDSGLVVSFMAELSPQVRTFSIGFGEQDYNELPAARLVAERYGTEHTEFVVEPHALDLLPQLVWHYGEPYGDSSAMPTYILSQLTRRHVTVALNGDAGDENFAGYDRYRGQRDGAPGRCRAPAAPPAGGGDRPTPSPADRATAPSAAPAASSASWPSRPTGATRRG